MRYKVGDKVRVRGDLEVGKSYGDITFISSMEKNKTFKILFAIDSENYDLDDEYELCYSSEMLRPAEFKILCETEEEKQAVLEELEKEGYVWWDDCSKPTKSSGKNAKCGLYVSENGLSISYDDDYYIRDDRVEITPSEFTGIDFSEKIIITKTSTGATATYGDKTVTAEGDFEDASRQALAEVLCPFKVGDRVRDRRCKNKGIVKEIRFNGEVVVHLDSADGDYDMTFKTLELLESYVEPSYNAKLFCIKGSRTFNKGYIYEVKDGKFTDEHLTQYKPYKNPYKDLENVNSRLIAQFMEVKGGLNE